MIEKTKQISAMGMVGTIALILTTSIIVAPITSWVLGISRSVGESNSRLEAVTVSQSEWERLQHMSLNELRSNKTALATPYKVGEDYQVKVNLGAEGYFLGGTCGNVPSGKTANCFKDTTITVFNSDGDRLFSSRQLPLQVGIYTAEEIDAKLTALSNALKNDYTAKSNANTTKINNEGTVRANKDNDLQNQINGLPSKFSGYYTKDQTDSLLSTKGIKAFWGASGYVAPADGVVIISGESRYSGDGQGVPKTYAFSVRKGQSLSAYRSLFAGFDSQVYATVYLPLQ